MSKSKAKWINLDYSDADALTADNIYCDLSTTISEGITNASSVSSGSGVDFYQDDVELIGTDTNNDNEVHSLFKDPQGGDEVVEMVNCTNNTVLGTAYLYNTELHGNNIHAGEWLFHTYCSVSSVIGGRESSITRNIFLVKVGTGTLTTTGSGTTRTATASSGTPFDGDDDNADITLCGYIETPQGLYAIPGYTSATVISITTPTTYSNESVVAYSVWKYQFGSNSGAITTLNTNYQPISHNPIVFGNIPIEDTDKLGEVLFGISNNSTEINWTHNGMESYSHFHSPIPTDHNDLINLQGGTTDEYYHLTEAQYSANTIKYYNTIGNGSDTDIVVTHNLNTKNVVVSIHRVASPYDEVQPTIEKTSLNTITVKFISVPSNNEYATTIIG